MAQTGTDISAAAAALRSGRLVGIPTETVYGLAADAFDPDAVAAIYAAKNRPSFDPLIIHAANIEQIRTLTTHIPREAEILAEAFWPGPLTLLLPKNDSIPDIVTAGMPDAAFRVPDNPLTLELLSSLPFPLVAPSANPFGYISPTTAHHVNQQLGDKIDYILDGGPCKVGVESTIIGFPQGSPVIYRAGGLTREEIESLIGPITLRSHSTSNPKAPGMLRSHYAPRVPVVLGDINALAHTNRGKRLGILSFGGNEQGEVNGAILRNLSPSGNLQEAAKNLFGFMRELDDMDLDLIITQLVPARGLGRAINDRLRRAAAE